MRCLVIAIATLMLLTACAPSSPTPTSPPSKATEPSAKPAAAESPAASPVAKPAASPVASPAASPVAATASQGTAAAVPARTYNEASVADFYRGKTLSLIVSSTPGGGYDLYARALARHIGRHVPGNPTVIVQNMPGAGGIVAANNVFGGSQDGTVFATFSRGMPAEELFGSEGIRFKSNEFHWMGSMNDEVSVCAARTDSPIKSFDDLYTTEMTVGGTGAGADTDFFPLVLNKLFGTRFRVIGGYPGGNEVNLGVERGAAAGPTHRYSRRGQSGSSHRNSCGSWSRWRCASTLTCRTYRW